MPFEPFFTPEQIVEKLLAVSDLVESDPSHVAYMVRHDALNLIVHNALAFMTRERVNQLMLNFDAGSKILDSHPEVLRNYLRNAAIECEVAASKANQGGVASP